MSQLPQDAQVDPEKNEGCQNGTQEQQSVLFKICQGDNCNSGGRGNIAHRDGCYEQADGEQQDDRSNEAFGQISRRLKPRMDDLLKPFQ
jgi:hypothetical protein